MYTNMLNIIFILLNVFLDYLNMKKLPNTINKHTQRYN